MPLAFPSSLWVPVSIQNVSSVATVSFTNLGAYRELRLLIDGLSCSADDFPRIRTSTDNGSTYDSGATDYKEQGNTTWSGNSSGHALPTGNTDGIYFPNDGVISGGLVAAKIHLFGFNQSKNMLADIWCGGDVTDSLNEVTVAVGWRLSTTARNAFHIDGYNGSNISGYFILEGIVG